MATTKIEWADKSWNPITGCTPISEGCAHCYAKRMASRLAGRFGYPEDEPFKVTLHPDKMNEPLKWKKPCRIFVCSMGDVFHDDVRALWLDYMMEEVIARCPQHTFMLLTKRERRMKLYIEDRGIWLPNLWLGVSVENQRWADERIPILLSIPAAKHFVSVEPMLEAVDLEKHLFLPPEYDRKLDWVIAGPETGPGARAIGVGAIEALASDCKLANVPFFDKRKAYIRREWPE